MADFAINDAQTSCKHDVPNAIPGKPCPNCGKVIPVKVGKDAAPEEWKNDANARPKNWELYS